MKSDLFAANKFGLVMVESIRNAVRVIKNGMEYVLKLTLTMKWLPRAR